MLDLRRLAVVVVVLLCGALGGCGMSMFPQLGEVLQQPVRFQPVGLGEDAVKLAVHETGRGKPLILIHGLGASSYTWHKVTPELAKTHRVIAIDLKGFGRSDKPLDDRYSIFDQARLIEDYITRNNLKSVTLVGHSYGGGVALMVALMMKDHGHRNIDRMILIDSIAYRQPLPFFFQLLKTPIIGELGLSLIPPELQMARALEVAYYEDGKVSQEMVDNYASALHSEGGRHALRMTIEKLDPVTADKMSKRYKELNQPTLVLWCYHDKITPIKIGKRLAYDMPNARIKLIENCGHIPHEEQPEETLLTIRNFLPG